MVQKLLKISLLAFFSLFLTSEDLLVTSMTEEEYINLSSPKNPGPKSEFSVLIFVFSISNKIEFFMISSK